MLNFTFKTIALFGLILAVTGTPVPLDDSVPLPGNHLSTGNAVVDPNEPISRLNIAELQEMGRRANLSGLANTLIVQPLVNFNNKVSQAAGKLPGMLGNEGQRIGNVIAKPIQFSTNTTMELVKLANETIYPIVTNQTTAAGAGNGTFVKNVVKMLNPFRLLGQLNKALGNLARNTVNATSTRINNRIDALGSSITKTGEKWKSVGAQISNWVRTGQGIDKPGQVPIQNQVTEVIKDTANIVNEVMEPINPRAGDAVVAEPSG